MSPAFLLSNSRMNIRDPRRAVPAQRRDSVSRKQRDVLMSSKASLLLLDASITCGTSLSATMPANFGQANG